MAYRDIHTTKQLEEISKRKDRIEYFSKNKPGFSGSSKR
jgi:hypothetical protein